jgi:hypothetical protein
MFSLFLSRSRAFSFLSRLFWVPSNLLSGRKPDTHARQDIGSGGANQVLDSMNVRHVGRVVGSDVLDGACYGAEGKRTRRLLRKDAPEHLP